MAKRKSKLELEREARRASFDKKYFEQLKSVPTTYGGMRANEVYRDVILNGVDNKAITYGGKSNYSGREMLNLLKKDLATTQLQQRSKWSETNKERFERQRKGQDVRALYGLAGG